MDKGFDAVKDHILFLEVNTTGAREHVAEIEREMHVLQISVPDHPNHGTYLHSVQCVFMAERLPTTIRYYRRVITQITSDRVNRQFYQALYSGCWCVRTSQHRCDHHKR